MRLGLGLGLGLGRRRAAAWTPADLGANLLLALEDDAANLYQSTDTSDPAALTETIGLWAGAHGTARTAGQATADQRPVWEADGLRTDGANDSLVLSPALNLAGDFTVYAVGRREVGGALVVLGGADAPFHAVLVHFDNNVYVLDGAEFPSVAYTGTSGAPVLLRVSRSGTTVSVAATGMASADLSGPVPGAVQPTRVLSRGTTAPSNSTSRLRAVYVVDRLLTAGERTDFEAFITGKYGVSL